MGSQRKDILQKRKRTLVKVNHSEIVIIDFPKHGCQICSLRPVLGTRVLKRERPTPKQIGESDRINPEVYAT